MMANIAKALVTILPIIWKSFSTSVKVGLTVAAFFIVAIYTVLSFWAAAHTGLLNAFDERWYQLEKDASKSRSENVATINSSILSLANEQKVMRQDQSEMKSDIREIRNALLNPHR